AGHNLSDVLGLGLAWAAARMSLRPPSGRHTYGMASATILAALLNAALLLFACGALVWESIARLAKPAPVPGPVVIAVALIGVAINLGSAWMFRRNRAHDLNARGAYLHLMADAAVSLGVAIAGALIWLTGWHWLDPLTGIGIALVILVSTIGLLRESLGLALNAVPRGLDLERIRAALLALSGVRAVHDLHVWPLSTTVAALTVHLEHDGVRDGDLLLADAQTAMRVQFGIEHTTIQLENVGCGQAC
ncbi:MAG: cation diffusion facilitator family transporter, partial [Ilumatobacteraceae bacterium]